MKEHMIKWVNERISLSRWQWFVFWGLMGAYLTFHVELKDTLLGGLVLAAVLVVLIFGAKDHGFDA